MRLYHDARYAKVMAAMGRNRRLEMVIPLVSSVDGKGHIGPGELGWSSARPDLYRIHITASIDNTDRSSSCEDDATRAAREELYWYFFFGHVSVHRSLATSNSRRLRNSLQPPTGTTRTAAGNGGEATAGGPRSSTGRRLLNYHSLCHYGATGSCVPHMTPKTAEAEARRAPTRREHNWRSFASTET